MRDRSEQIDSLLLELGERRQGNVSAQTLVVYGFDLEPYELEDIRTACQKIGSTEPDEFKPRFPTSPALVAEVKLAKHNRETRIRPEQLRPEVRMALARTEEHKRLLAAGGEGLESFSVKELLDSLPQHLLSMDVEKPKPPRPAQYVPPEMLNTCPHCGNQGSPQTSAMLRQLANYYAKKADNAEEEERETVEGKG